MILSKHKNKYRNTKRDDFETQKNNKDKVCIKRLNKIEKKIG